MQNQFFQNRDGLSFPTEEPQRPEGAPEFRPFGEPEDNNPMAGLAVESVAVAVESEEAFGAENDQN